jgi:hypothetical protein
MSELIPSERLAFYNEYGDKIVLSAVEAIDDAVRQADGSSCDLTVLQKVHDLIANSWKMSDHKTDFRALQLPLAALICEAISQSKGRDLTEAVGQQVIDAVNLALKNLMVGLMDMYRDVLINAGVDPNDPTLRRP